MTKLNIHRGSPRLGTDDPQLLAYCSRRLAAKRKVVVRDNDQN